MKYQKGCIVTVSRDGGFEGTNWLINIVGIVVEFRSGRGMMDEVKNDAEVRQAKRRIALDEDLQGMRRESR